MNSIEKPGWELIGKYLSGEANPAEVKEVENWASASQQNQQELEQARLLLLKTNEFYQLKRFNTGEAWTAVRQRALPERVIGFAAVRKRVTVMMYKYAAILVIAFLLGITGIYLSLNYFAHSGLTAIASSEQGVLNEYVLPDGSVVALNSNSRLEFPDSFDKDVREVTVTGEAFFDVRRDPDRPFIIKAGNARVRVLGTSFNVNAYPEAEAVEVTVKTGVVQVVCCDGGEPGNEIEILLNAGEKGTLINANGKLEKTFNTDPNYLAWKTRNLVFEETSLKEVVRYLDKVYHTDIQLRDKKLENLMLTAQFENKSPEFILDVIRLTFDLELTRENGTYVLSDHSSSIK